MAAEEKKYSILDELSRCSGYDMALMTTFNFEIGFFERAVLNRLYAKDVKKISVFVDSKELTNALNDFDMEHSGCHIGRKYMVNPVQMNGSFHPKVILLLGEKKARLFVGSANIKTSGYAINNEIFNFIDYSPEHPEYLDVIVDAIDFFQNINEKSYKLDNEMLKAAKEYIYYHKVANNGETYLVHNLDKPILNQVTSLITDNVTGINIAVPYYDKELLALREIIEAFPSADIKLYIQNEFSTFPVQYNDDNHIIHHISKFTKFKDNTSSSSGNFYHGKVFQFKTNDKDYILYGSANCTLSALISTYDNGGNVECDLFEVGENDEFDYFFENMVIDDSKKLLSQPMIFEHSEVLNFYYKYGEVKGLLELYLGYGKRIDGIAIMLGDTELEYDYVGDELIVTIPEEIRENISEIFEINIVFDNNMENIRCWTYSTVILSNNRVVQGKRDDLADFDADSSGDKYLEDRIKVLNADATCFADWQEYMNNQKYINQIKLEREGNEGEAEDYIVDFQIPDEYRYAYKRYRQMEKIRRIFINRFMGRTWSDENEKAGGKTKKYDEEIDTAADRKSRKATTAEKSFERFIKTKVKGMLNDVYVDVVELEHYIGLVGVIIDIFDKYTKEENVEDIFKWDYVINTEVALLSIIIQKWPDKGVEISEFPEKLICKCFGVIFDNYLYYRGIQDHEERWKYESLNKSFLAQIEKQFCLRTNYTEYIKLMLSKNLKSVLLIGYNDACKYIEKLYGYKDYNQLCDFIQNRYRGAEILIKGSTFRIAFETDMIKEYYKPDSDVLREISNYSRYVSKINTVVIAIKNIDANASVNAIETLKHSILLEYRQWNCVERRFNGITYKSTGQYYSF
ncbi:MAG: hypothetical protein E7271_03870 [Lachnospiraceae bacterium]|jgi:hypothetical protein|nr:hypothetical protein [Lachnospiraceae bacterium]